MVPKEDRGISSGMLTLRTAEDGDRWVLCLCGELDLSNAEELELELAAALERDCEEVVVDLSELTFIDSTGIALLLSALRREGGSRIRFVPSTSDGVRRVFEITGLDGKLPLVKGAAAGYSAAGPPNDDRRPAS